MPRGSGLDDDPLVITAQGAVLAEGVIDMQAYALLQAFMAIETARNSANPPYVPVAPPRRGLGSRIAAAVGHLRRALTTPVSAASTETPRLEGYPYRT